LNPNTGLFVSDNVCLGLSMPILYMDNDLYLGISPFMRYYLKEKSDKSLYFSGALGLTTLLSEIDINQLDYNLLRLGVGHVWMLNDFVGFESELKLGTSLESVNFGFVFGFQIYFKREKNGI